MATPREMHTATLLQNGQVLIAGGYDSGGIAQSSAELYDPKKIPGCTPIPNNAAMAQKRCEHTATLLRDGRVLIAGGINNLAFLSDGEIYDPNGQTFTSIAGKGWLQTKRMRHTATLLQDGRVLIAGGVVGALDGRGALSSAELFDPTTNGFLPFPREEP